MNKILNTVAEALKRNAAYRQTVRELSALDNRGLVDLGITRADIAQIARDHSRTIY